MPLHRLLSVTIGVPDVARTGHFYRDFGLSPDPYTSGSFSTEHGGRQLLLTHAPIRRLERLRIAVDDSEDLERVARDLIRLDLDHHIIGPRLTAVEPCTGIQVVLEIAARLTQEPAPETRYNRPGVITRENERADVVDRSGPVRPLRLGHCVVGTPHHEPVHRFFTEGIGFKVSDEVRGQGTFLRCSTDHHNLLINPAPVTFLHHTSWQVSDVDEIGRGATAMLEQDPARHVWGLGRHCIGSNFFWYLRDPAGNFAEYYSDMDAIVDDARWHPQVWEEAKGLYLWGPPPPPSFVKPDDLAAMMTGAHSAH